MGSGGAKGTTPSTPEPRDRPGRREGRDQQQQAPGAGGEGRSNNHQPQHHTTVTAPALSPQHTPQQDVSNARATPLIKRATCLMSPQDYPGYPGYLHLGGS